MILLRMVAPSLSFSFFSPRRCRYCMGISWMVKPFLSIWWLISTSMSKPLDFTFQFLSACARITRKPVRGSCSATPFSMLCVQDMSLFPR